MSRVRNKNWPQFLIGLAVIATIAGLATTVAGEIAMTPSETERNQLISLLISIAAASIAITVIFRLIAPRSLTRRMLVAGTSGPVVIAVALSAGSRSMFLSEENLGFLLILLAFATVLGIGVIYTLARPLTDDLAALTAVAKRVGSGDLDARAELQRMDEVGELAGALDDMVEQISVSRQQRDEAEHERSVTLASLSHDARTPLTSMRLATEALLDGVATDPDRYLRTIESDITAVETLINDLFTIGQLEAGRLQMNAVPMNVMTTLRDVAEQMGPIADAKNVRVLINGPEHLEMIADSAQLHRVIANLVSNSLRYSPEGEVVCIDVDPEVFQVSVLDAGPGFRAGFTEEAFEPFRRDDEARQRAQGGAGLGLAVARGIVEALGGRIWADAGPGGKVHLRIPA